MRRELALWQTERAGPPPHHVQEGVSGLALQEGVHQLVDCALDFVLLEVRLKRHLGLLRRAGHRRREFNRVGPQT